MQQAWSNEASVLQCFSSQVANLYRRGLSMRRERAAGRQGERAHNGLDGEKKVKGEDMKDSIIMCLFEDRGFLSHLEIY